MRAFYILVVFLAVVAAPIARADAVDRFPYPLIEVPVDEAWDAWTARRDGPGTPIIVGNRVHLERLAQRLDPDAMLGLETPAEILALAADLPHPGGLYAMREIEWRDFRAWALENGNEALAAELGETFPPPLRPGELGEWDANAPRQLALAITTALKEPAYPTLFIAILPTENAYEAAAYLRFGGWNASPAPEIHVAAARAWYTQYGAVPVVMLPDVLEFSVAEPPRTRQAAMDLALEFFYYDRDIVYQGTGSVAALGSALLNAPFWFFWWD
ncbi:MAG: DUF4253 domain-containing protein [Pseudomonadota bacterium]